MKWLVCLGSFAWLVVVAGRGASTSGVFPWSYGTVPAVGQVWIYDPGGFWTNGTVNNSWSGLTTGGLLQATSASTVGATLTPSGLTSLTGGSSGLTLAGDPTGATLTLGQGANGGIVLTPSGTGYTAITGLLWLDSGNSNLFIGAGAGNGATTFSTCIGPSAGASLQSDAINQVLIGYQAGASLTSGAENVFVGYSAGVSATTAKHSNFIGGRAGQVVTTGINNNFMGNDAGESVTTGGGNTIVGDFAGNALTSGDSNTFIGVNAGNGIVTGGSNTALGEDAFQSYTGFSGVAVGTQCLDQIVTGTDLVGMGRLAGHNATGSQVTVVGSESDTFAFSNATALGYGALANASNEVSLGNEAVTSLVLAGMQLAAVGPTAFALGNISTLTLSGQLTSTVPNGISPFVVTSTTNVPNLNASSLSGATFAAPGPIGATTPGTGAFTTLSVVGIASGPVLGQGILGAAAARGLVLQGMGSANDVTIENSGGAAAIYVPTGTTNGAIAGNLLVNGTGTSSIASLAASTAPTNGALVVGSNVGLSGNSGGPAYFGGALNIFGEAEVGIGNQSAPAWGLQGIALTSGSATFTDTSTPANGATALETIFSLQAPTLAAASANVRTTRAATLAVTGFPATGANQSIATSDMIYLPFNSYVATGTANALEVLGNITPSAPVSNNQNGIAVTLNVSGSNDAQSVTGMLGLISCSSTGPNTGLLQMRGLAGDVRTGGSSTSRRITAVYGNIANNATTTLPNAYGFFLDAFSNSGTVTNTYGLYISALATGAQTNPPYSIYTNDGVVSVGNAGFPSPSWTTNGITFRTGSAVYTDSSTGASSTAASAVFVSFAAPTLAAVNLHVTTTDAATVYVAGNPAAGTNQTITNAWGLWNAGNLRVDGSTLRFTNGFTANGTTAIALTSVGPTGAHATVQKWLTVTDGTSTYYIPCF